MNKVIDTFLFTHEFDLLELRLRTLWPCVDQFIMMEGDHNFANQPKSMRYHEQAARFEWAKKKLLVIQCKGKYQDHQGEIDIPGELYVEHQHRQRFYDLVKAMPFDAEDILLISDIDELPSREAIERLKTEDFVSPTLLHQDFYYYNVKCPRGKKWHGTMAMRFGHDLGDIAAARYRRKNMVAIKENAGWHFCHFYDSEGIREKLQHSSHQGYNHPDFYNPEHLAKCVKENKHFLGKEDGDLPPEPLPEYLLNELKRFPIFMGEEWR